MSATRLVCASHSPLVVCYARPPEAFDAIEGAYAAQRAEIEAFDPELAIVFGCDHYNFVHLDMVPPFCVGLAAEAIGDIGGFAGPLDVPGETAEALAEALHEDGVDIAVSRRMTVDHGFSQVMEKVLGGVGRWPTVPIFVNAMAPPFLPFRRARLMGEAVGRFAVGLGKRVLFVASGGMSHNPTRYYPPLGEAPPEVASWQLAGEGGGGLDQAAWLDRLETMHHEGAQMLVDGTRTRADIKLNPETDRRFLAALVDGPLDALDSWVPAEVIKTAGIGFLELNTWIAATAAQLAAGGARPREIIYAETLEYGIAFGMVGA